MLEGLSNSSGIMGDTEFTLQHKAKVKSKKKAELYDAWDSQVFQKMQVCRLLANSKCYGNSNNSSTVGCSVLARIRHLTSSLQDIDIRYGTQLHV